MDRPREAILLYTMLWLATRSGFAQVHMCNADIKAFFCYIKHVIYMKIFLIQLIYQKKAISVALF
jgi:hypothetical protein